MTGEIDLRDGTEEPDEFTCAFDGWLATYYPEATRAEIENIVEDLKLARMSLKDFCAYIGKPLWDPQAIAAYGDLLVAQKVDHAASLGISPEKLHELGPEQARLLGAQILQQSRSAAA